MNSRSESTKEKIYLIPLSYIDLNFLHSAAAFIDHKKNINILSIGENKIIRDKNCHAEMDCIDRLPIRKSGKILKIDIIVIRITKSLILGNSKPCAVCLKYLYNKSKEKGYYINNLYFSNTTGEIEKYKFIDLVKHPEQIFSAYYRNRSINKEKFMKWINFM